MGYIVYRLIVAVDKTYRSHTTLYLLHFDNPHKVLGGFVQII